MESRKMVLMNLFARQQWINRHREQTYGHGKKGNEGKMYGESNMDTYITVYKIDSQWEFTVCLRELKQRLCDRLKGTMGREMGGRPRREGTWVYLWLILVDV